MSGGAETSGRQRRSSTSGGGSDRSRGRGAARWLALVALATAVLDLLVLAAFHVLSPQVDPVTEPTSAYAHASLGWLSGMVTVTTGIGALALARAVTPTTPGTGVRRANAGAVLLAVFGLAKLVQSAFPIDVAGEATSSGVIHDVTGNLAFFTLPVAAVLLGPWLRAWTGRRYPAVIGWALLAAVPLVLAGDAVGVFGLAQRLSLVLAAGWVGAAAAAIVRPSSSRTVPRGEALADPV